jgi:hypothetical protein
MITTRKRLTRLAILGIILLALLIFSAFQAGSRSAGLAAGAAPNSPAAISAGQQAAIEGAQQLLLLSQFNQTVYLPLITR